MAPRGRQKGTPNRSTIIKRMIAEEITSDPQEVAVLMQGPPKPRVAEIMSGKAIDVLQHFMGLCADYALRHWPRYDDNGEEIGGDEQKAMIGARMTADFAAKLAPFQSPTYKAVALIDNPNESRSLLKDLLQEVDEAGRPLIEAQPVEQER